jgi:TPR repeat protein
MAPDGRDTRQKRRIFEQWRSSPRWSPFCALLMLAAISAAGAVSSNYWMPAARTAAATRFLETLRIVISPGSAKVEAKLASTSPHHAAQAQAPRPAAARPRISPALAAIALARGDELMRLGDIASARRFYEIAADAAIPGAAWSLARSYDPRFLHRIGAVGVQGDAAKAAHWYRRAAEAGASAPAAP